MPPIEWKSSDESRVYTAYPFGGDIPEPEVMREISVWRFHSIMNLWELTSCSKPTVDERVVLYRYLLGAGLPMQMTSHELDIDTIIALENGEDEALEQFNKDSMLQHQLGLTKQPELLDYAYVENAIYDLSKIIKAEMWERMEARSQMTPDEIRWEKMQKYAQMFGPEQDKLGEPCWWGISEFNQLYAVQASSPDEAAILVEEFIGAPLTIFFVEKYEDEDQPSFEEKYADRGVVRLIPFSKEEWPENPASMTAEQRVAFDRLK